MKPGEGYEVTADLYDIAKRLREIDPDYRVWYSYRRHKYEIHNVGQRGGTYALTVPYGELDERTLRLVRRTRAENAAEFIRECADEYPDEITLVSLGPLTNVATVLDRYPESFAKLDRLVIMGGELAAKQAEWNLRLDAVAAAKVLLAGKPITLVPLEATRPCVIDETAMREFDGITSPGMTALRPLLTAWKENFGKNLKCTMHDPLAVSLLTENFCEKQTRRLRVKTDGEKPGLLEETAAGAEITCAVNTDAKAFMRYFIDRLKGDEVC